MSSDEIAKLIGKTYYSEVKDKIKVDTEIEVHDMYYKVEYINNAPNRISCAQKELKRTIDELEKNKERNSRYIKEINKCLT